MAGIVPPGYQPMVDWCTQPAPEFRGDTHALHFYLINAQPTLHETDRYMYHGYLFWKETPPRPRGVMEGFGRVIGNLAYAIHANEPAIEEPPKDWVRVSMSLTPHIAGVGVEFLDSGNDGFPGQRAYTLEWDLPTDPPPSSRYEFQLKHSQTGQLEFLFTVQLMTLMF